MSFVDAAYILTDPMCDAYHVETYDERHSTEDEERWITVGSDPDARESVLFIVWTGTEIGTRVIPACAVARAERREYDAQVRSRFGW